MDKATIFVLVVLLHIGFSALHYAVAGTGNHAYNDKNFDQHFAFIVVALLEFILVIVILLDLFKHCLSRLS